MGEQRARVRCVPAVPCWVSLMARDLGVAKAFYGPLLGWTFEPGPDRWGEYVWAVVDGVEVAGLGVMAGDWQPPVAWTTYFGIESADRAAEGVRERGGTLAVGPLAFDAGRVALAADPQGAVFGIWEGEPGVETWMKEPGAPVWIELRSPDPFAAALFYGEVFRWDSRDKEHFEVRYEHERVVLRSEGRNVAALRAARGQAPHWEVFFSVADTDAAVLRAVELGGSVAEPAGDTPYGRTARLQDTEGGIFSVIGPGHTLGDG
ncbi:VOC family protein [Kitasatospora sp. DSM 101779]|uniref:VOC family protein n=1 Tax=Kitasatospora sp. DSM 101779 TaxID=2853165 RepID=UPI0021DA24B9|nr:VOC family protein [Kitasatospora sp. DSM 101779]MCU7825593.1 VOC family protein [Kitasatospora sp. DSM 101779]